MKLIGLRHIPTQDLLQEIVNRKNVLAFTTETGNLSVEKGCLVILAYDFVSVEELKVLPRQES